MRKLRKKRRLYLTRKRQKQLHKELIAATIRKNKKLLKRIRKPKVKTEIALTRSFRHKLTRELYKPRIYNGPNKAIIIDHDFGIEEKGCIDYFLTKAEEFVDFNSKKLQFDISKCDRIWPSAITLLCSLMQWVELTRHQSSVPTLSSNNSQNDKVNSYLAHCGFYNYVKRLHNSNNSYYKDDEIIKIKREKSLKDVDIETKEDEIISLLTKYSRYSCDEIEHFDSVILTEVFNNVREHGIVNIDKGWWLLAQYHKTHKVISLCIADNGIGIKNSLLTGPQRFEIQEKYPLESKNDGDLIRLALSQNISGAITASLKTKRLLGSSYERGARRGNGLSKILAACKTLNISFSLLSHKGYVFIDSTGQIIKCGTRDSRIFAGTLYNFTIPAN